MAAVMKGRKSLPVAEPEDDFEAGPSDEEPEEDAGSSSGSGSDDDLDAAGSSGEDDDQDEDFGSDDGVEEGMPSGSEGEGEEDEEQEGGSGSGSGSDDDEEGGGGRQGGFLEGGKAASFAKAFAKILDTSGKKAAEAAEAVGAAPILAVSKSIAKRKAEVEAETKADREAKKLRQEMKQRGHVVPKRRGQDPTADVREKALQRLATKGVVRLFNAIAKAQKQLREAEEASGSRAKAVKLGKASFLAQLKGSAAAAAGGAADQPLVPSAPRQAIPGVAAAAAAAAPAAGTSGSRKQQQRRAAADDSSEDEEDAAGWDVLKQGFVGLQGGGKMKDWDKEGSDEEGAGGDQLEGMSSDGDDE